jgi:hypothetical protein
MRSYARSRPSVKYMEAPPFKKGIKNVLIHENELPCVTIIFCFIVPVPAAASYTSFPAAGQSSPPFASP